jgi:putative glutamine amidotransferase
VRRPLIGITTYHRSGEDRPRFGVPTSYVDAVRVAGGRAVLLPPGDEDPATLLDEVDGVVLCGGGDVDPALFGGATGHDAQYATCPERDAFELALVEACIERRTPTLAICRGMQVLNVARGGALHVHLPDVVGEAVSHRVSRERHTHHPVRIAPDSRLASLLGSETLEVASWHHQAIDRLGGGLRAVAWADDGTVEAVEVEACPELWAVQWHPELQVGEAGGRQRRLFEALVAAAASAVRARRPAARRRESPSR